MDHSEKIDLHADPLSRSKGKGAQWLLLIIAGLPALATILAFGAPWWDKLDLLSHFRVQYAFILIITVIASMCVRLWRLGLILLIPTTINLALILPLYFHPGWFLPRAEFVAQEPDGGPVVRLITYRIDPQLPQTEDMLELIRNAPADMIVLQGVNTEILRYLEYAVAPFRVVGSHPREDGLGSAILVRVSIRSPIQMRYSKPILLDDVADLQAPPAICTVFYWYGREVLLLTLQGVSPLSPHRTHTQQRQFNDLATWMRRQQEPVVVMGNLNSTPWSYHFRKLLEDSSLHNSQQGFGIQGTWPATGGALGQLPLDHCLLSPSLKAVKRQVGPSLTSSHHMLQVDIQWTSGASTPPMPEPLYDIEDNQRADPVQQAIDRQNERVTQLHTSGRLTEYPQPQPVQATDDESAQVSVPTTRPRRNRRR